MRSIYRAGRGSAQELGLRKIGLWPVRRSSIASAEMSTGWKLVCQTGRMPSCLAFDFLWFLD
jgi:hypothetical protein